MNSFDPDNSELEDAINKAKSPQSPSTDDVSDSLPSSGSLWIGSTIEISLPVVSVEVLSHALALNLGPAYAVATCGKHSPPPPQHENPDEERRLYHLWRRERHWVGLTGLQIKEKYLRRDLTDCSGKLVRDLDELNEPDSEYCPSVSENPKRWIPRCPDRLDAAKQPALQARVAAAKIDRDISEFFRPTDQLGLGNEESLALADFERQFRRDEELFKTLTGEVPHTLSLLELQNKLQPGGGGSNIRNPTGRGGFPR